VLLAKNHIAGAIKSIGNTLAVLGRAVAWLFARV
jgi:hypothetical protein